MRHASRNLRLLLAVVIATQSLAPTGASADHLFDRVKQMVCEPEYQGTPPCTGHDCAMEQLAQNIDWLEHYIDTYGSVVAKQPDIWGEARLTKHRDEYERVLFTQLDDFEVKINAAITQSDSSFLAQALALSAAVGGSPAISTDPNASQDQKITSEVKIGTTTAQTVDVDPALKNPNGTTADFQRFGVANQPGKAALELEPVLELDQLSRYVQHLHELRRINEGDDTSDSPGYSLNLVRIPVSILPGKHTRTGFGAEVTVTATPVLSDDLMPTTFRNLVVNDLVSQLGLTIVRFAERQAWDDIEGLRKAQADLAKKERERSQLKAKQKSETGKLASLNNEITSLKDQIALARTEFDATRSLKEEVAVDYERLIALNSNPVEASALRKGPTDTPPSGRSTSPTLSEENYLALLSKLDEEAYAELEKAKFASNGPRNIENIPLPAAIAADEAEVGVMGSAALRARVDQDFLRMIDPQAEDLLLLEPPVDNSNQPDDQRAPNGDVAPFNGGNSDSSESGPPALAVGNVKRYEARYSFLEEAFDEYEKDYTKQYKDQNDKLTELERKLTDLLAAKASIESSLAEVSAKLVTMSTDIQTSVKAISSLAAAGSSGGFSSTRNRRARHPLPPSQVVQVFGLDCLAAIAKDFYASYQGRHVRWAGCNECGGSKECRVNLLDVRRWLQAELDAAYELLSQPMPLMLLSEAAKPENGLAEMIRQNHMPYEVAAERGFGNRQTVHDARGAFICQLNKLNPAWQADVTYPCCESTLECLAWAVAVESALLNQRLNEDSRKVAMAKECHCLSSDKQYHFFLPDAVMRQGVGLEELQGEFQLATQAFQEYVRCRWPIHVFAIDPREQDQNVADVSARKRELQFALALGFATGKIGVNSLTQFSRELETQVETISLNRTIVGFGHGADTFGWRFYPRVQALPVPGTLGAIRETLCGASRDYDLRHRQLEPGQRECVAVVLMPSFVPYADFDVRANWFRLTNPKQAALTMKDSVMLSRAITAMRNSRAQCASCQHLYRQGELRRMFKRVDQLDRELPLQTQRAQVPYENTLGGFEMFNTGVSDLSPELIGWYGAPGVNIGGKYECGCFQGCQLSSATCSGDGCDDVKQQLDAVKNELEQLKTGLTNAQYNISPLPECEGPGTTLFLVGSNFSVHDTKVIAGGVCIPHTQLISRDIIRVTIPSCVRTVELCEKLGKKKDGTDNIVKKDYVAVYLATPYGVTNHLHVPVQPTAGAVEADEETLKKLMDAAKEGAKGAIEEFQKKELSGAIGSVLQGSQPPLPKVSLEKGKTLKVSGRHNEEQGNLDLDIKLGDRIEVGFELAGDKRLRAGMTATFSASIFTGSSFLGPLVSIPGGEDIKLDDKNGGKLTLPGNDNDSFEAGLMAQLSDLRYADIKDEAEEYKLVFYADLKRGGHVERVRLGEQVALKVEKDKCDCAPEPTPAEEDSTYWSPQGSVTPVQFANQWEPEGQRRQRRTPARFVQANGDVVTADELAREIERLQGLINADQQARVADRAVLQEQSRAIQTQIEALRVSNEALQTQQNVLRTGVASDQSVINIRVDAPPTPDEDEGCKWWDADEHPVINQMKIKAGERFRNLRDQLPCN